MENEALALVVLLVRRRRQPGHSSISTTADLYAHYDEAAATEAAERLAAVMEEDV